jgi:hypothetical protein
MYQESIAFVDIKQIDTGIFEEAAVQIGFCAGGNLNGIDFLFSAKVQYPLSNNKN